MLGILEKAQKANRMIEEEVPNEETQERAKFALLEALVSSQSAPVS